MDARTKRTVRERAQDRCEYCRVPQSAYVTPFQIDHIIARKHQGETSIENLAFACFHCNSHKGPNLSGVDPSTGLIETLFNPRQHGWKEHFQLLPNGTFVGLSSIGRSTIETLRMNAKHMRDARAALIAEGQLLIEGAL